mmetsp:Transcript_95066/g.255188  ORF Transcript_95066/g.255188 Transcript_95066/m.255188 type:complete len:504 (-) Transcript_95066:2827-4338(-)
MAVERRRAAKGTQVTRSASHEAGQLRAGCHQHGRNRRRRRHQRRWVEAVGRQRPGAVRFPSCGRSGGGLGGFAAVGQRARVAAPLANWLVCAGGLGRCRLSPSCTGRPTLFAGWLPPQGLPLGSRRQRGAFRVRLIDDALGLGRPELPRRQDDHGVALIRLLLDLRLLRLGPRRILRARPGLGPRLGGQPRRLGSLGRLRGRGVGGLAAVGPRLLLGGLSGLGLGRQLPGLRGALCRRGRLGFLARGRPVGSLLLRRLALAALLGLLLSARLLARGTLLLGGSVLGLWLWLGLSSIGLRLVPLWLHDLGELWAPLQDEDIGVVQSDHEIAIVVEEAPSVQQCLLLWRHSARALAAAAFATPSAVLEAVPPAVRLPPLPAPVALLVAEPAAAAAGSASGAASASGEPSALSVAPPAGAASGATSWPPAGEAASPSAASSAVAGASSCPLSCSDAAGPSRGSGTGRSAGGSSTGGSATDSAEAAWGSRVASAASAATSCPGAALS